VQVFGDELVSSIPKWLDRFLEPAEFDVKDADFDPVLIELLNYPDIDIRYRAAQMLDPHRATNFQHALPVLLEVCRRHPNPTYRGDAALQIGTDVDTHPKEVKTAIEPLLKCHELETVQWVRNRIVETLRNIDPRADRWPPLTYDYWFDEPEPGFFNELKQDRTRYLWLTVASPSDDRGTWQAAYDRTTPSGAGEALTQVVVSSDLSTHTSVSGHPVRNIELRVSIKSLSGAVEQGGGLVWRRQDMGNYYAAGIDPRDGSLHLDRFADGKRIPLGCKDGLKLKTGEWYTLSVKHVGDKIECSVDGTKYLEASDRSISKPGGFGMWTRADAETHFDGLRVIDYGE
jgi:hypothetical protein